MQSSGRPCLRGEGLCLTRSLEHRLETEALVQMDSNLDPRSVIGPTTFDKLRYIFEPQLIIHQKS